MSAGKAVPILTKQSNTMNVFGVLSVSHVLILNQSDTYVYALHICIYICMYMYIIMWIFTQSIIQGADSPSDKCLAISSANDVKRAKFMFQHDIDIFIYTDMYIHSTTQKHIIYVFTTSCVACACLCVSLRSRSVNVCLPCGRACNMTY